MKRHVIGLALVVAVGVGCNEGGGGEYSQVVNPPSAPRFQTLWLTAHDLDTDANGNRTRSSSRQIGAAGDIWYQCNIAVKYSLRSSSVSGVDENGNFVWLGGKFVANTPNTAIHGVNWPNLWQVGARRGSTLSRGADAYWTREILLWNGSYYPTHPDLQPLGLSLPSGHANQNSAVMRPRDAGNDAYGLAHEIGHMLNLGFATCPACPDHPDPPGNLMCRTGSCMGTILTGAITTQNPQPASGTQCYIARDYGARRHFFDGT